jgi:hypothetical protein
LNIFVTAPSAIERDTLNFGVRCNRRHVLYRKDRHRIGETTTAATPPAGKYLRAARLARRRKRYTFNDRASVGVNSPADYLKAAPLLCRPPNRE